MKFKELLKIIKDDGWYEVRISGSHRQFHHPIKKEQLQLPVNQTKMFQKGL